MKNKISSFWIITIVLTVIKLTIHLLTFSVYELHRDEMLYFAMGDHLSFGYATTPPLVGFLAFISKVVFGYSEFGIKLFPALAGVASVVLVALMVREFGGKNMAVILAGTGFMAAGAFLRSNSLFQPVSFDQLFWLLSAYLTVRMVNTQNSKLWLWIGVFFGLAFLNKYSIVFFAFSLIMALIISQHRKLIFTKQFVFGMLLGFFVIIPNLLWQYTHNWPVLNHMVKLQQIQLVNVNSVDFFKDQLLNCASSIFIWIFGLLALIFLSKESKFRFVALSYILIVILIVSFHGKSYYTQGAYPMLLAAGGYAMEKYFRKNGPLLIMLLSYLPLLDQFIFYPWNYR